MISWRKLEQDFNSLSDPFDGMRADWSCGSDKIESWRIAAWPDKDTKKRFEAIAKIAGNLLLTSPTARSKCNSEILNEKNDLHRWLKGIWRISGTFEQRPPLVSHENAEQINSYIFLGSINNLVKASSLFCLELAAEEGIASINKPKYKKLIVWLSKHLVMIIGAIIATVIGGLIVFLLTQ